MVARVDALVSEKLLDTKSGKMVGVGRQTANHGNTTIILIFHHSREWEFLQEQH
jgi:hypothetical protein